MKDEPTLTIINPVHQSVFHPMLPSYVFLPYICFHKRVAFLIKVIHHISKQAAPITKQARFTVQNYTYLITRL